MPRLVASGGRALAGGVVGGALSLAVVACGGPPPAVDGDLTDGWPGLPEAAIFVPEAGTCHREAFRAVVAAEDYQPVDCEAPHLLETVHVGTFTGGPAEGDQPPAPGSAALRQAFEECEQRAADHLGADYRHGLLWMGVAVPTPVAWDGGARWFRCDLSELDSVVGDPVTREGDLAGALAEGSPLRLGCWVVEVGEGGELVEQSPVPCDEPHDAEFVGVWRAPDGPFPDPTDRDGPVHEGCRSRIAAYTGVPDDGNVRYRVGAIVDWMSERDWENGNRGFRCRLLVAEPVTGSLRNAGAEALPVRRR
ncbi:MAG TPA: septum formation family protein [Natronosporangium sp.]|nr:septum formation family protein [Natronosporangium sp.]